MERDFHSVKFDAEQEGQKTALLVGVYKGNLQKDHCLEHLDELDLLCETYGIKTVQKEAVPIRKFVAATLITSGKLQELVDLSKELHVDVVVFDDEINSSQQRNLEEIFQIPVMDRTEVILEVFAQRAQTKEARLQIELARLEYVAPRLKRMWTHLSRQAGTAGAGAYLKGEGEKQIEIDRRIMKDQILQLKRQLSEVKSHRETQRVLREKTGIPTFALVGYTNVGKSTLLNTLTQAGVFVEDKLFATLDTTTRKFTLPNNQEILLIDTVGFIRKLPHQLVAAFRSTLEEAVQGDIILHIVDISHHNAEEQATAACEVLNELGAANKPTITVLNKIDQCKDRTLLNKMKILYPKTVEISALKGEGLEALYHLMIEELSQQRTIVNLCIPQSAYALVSEVKREGKVIDEEYEGNDVIIKAEIPIRLKGKLEKYVKPHHSQSA